MSRPTVERAQQRPAMAPERAALVPQVYSLLEVAADRASALAAANTPSIPQCVRACSNLESHL